MAWRGVAALAWLLVVCVVVGSVEGKPGGQASQEDDSPGHNPVNNVWEYAFIHDRTNLGPRAGAQPITTTASNNNPCLWSIVQCCGASMISTRESCFEELGCPGAWFDNLCSAEFMRTAQEEVGRLFTNGLGRK
ncbi:hypothetical protein OTU49_009768 [Cherax quadricarinatus]|uniref:Uncharacterized protein n=1 Tax=Cherax quadricarinatus TaxID=27406 RepID=A0AAW0W9H2_CHEQU